MYESGGHVTSLNLSLSKRGMEFSFLRLAEVLLVIKIIRYMQMYIKYYLFELESVRFRIKSRVRHA